MTTKKIPFSPFPPKVMDSLSDKFALVGNLVAKRFPNLKLSLLQAGIDITPRKYGAIAFVTALFYGMLFILLFVLLTIILQIDLLILGILASGGFFGFMFFAAVFYPVVRARRRMRVLETNLIPALRHLFIEIKSGVPLFQAMSGITIGYGEVSEEFRKIVRDINTGTKETDALDEAAHRNPSFKFRRALWQITNAIKSGADIAEALNAIIEDLAREQITAVRRYGQELNPWTMIYMMAAVIIPSLGVAFLSIISSFSGAVIPNAIFPLIIFALLGFQLFFMNFVKSKRPAV
jgi:pilus assembly protein TadC